MIDNAEAMNLTRRERDILQRLAEGRSNREIAAELVLSLGTIKWYNRQLYNKLAVSNRRQAAAVAKQQGIIERDFGARGLPNNLPAMAAPCIGREQELGALAQLVDRSSTRLITITGSGGIGKTRLALELGSRLASTTSKGSLDDGIYFVDLAPATDTGLVVANIADAIDFRFQAGDTLPEEQLLRHLKSKRLVLILDNFEHLLESASFVARILERAPHVKLLATSRERLNLSSESVFKLTGLDCPVDADLEDVLAAGAAQLFVRSARQVRKTFTPGVNDSPAIVRICRVVHGMPLAIILAAAWVETLSVGEIAEEIARNMDILASEQRDLPRRLRSIRAVFDHSWKMMTNTEARVFMGLCIFRGGFTRAAGGEVAGADLRILMRLTNKSLIQRDTDGGRYVIHELLRQYAEQRLQTSGQSAAVRAKHAEYYAGLAERAKPELRSVRQEEWFQVLEAEHDNLRAALSWSFENGFAAVGLRIVVALRDFWFYQDHHVEGLRWYEDAISRTEADDAPLRGRLLLALGLYDWACHRMEDCERNWAEALEIFRQAGDRRRAAWALGFTGGSQLTLSPAGYRSSVERIETAIRTLEEFDDLPGIAQMLCVLGNIHRIPGEHEQATAAYRACLRVVRRTGERRRECMILDNLALIAYIEGDYERAMSLSKEAAALAHEIGYRSFFSYGLNTLAGSLAVMGQAVEAARLAGAVDAHHDALGLSFAPLDQPYHDRIRGDIARRLGEEVFRAAHREGYRMSIESAVKSALEA